MLPVSNPRLAPMMERESKNWYLSLIVSELVMKFIE